MSSLISVIMYCNHVDYFSKDTIESILFQEYSEFELIVIDSSLSDFNKKICMGYNDNRLKYYNIDPIKGKSFALNAGMEYSQGKYIAFATSDSVSQKTRLQIQKEYLENQHRKYL